MKNKRLISAIALLGFGVVISLFVFFPEGTKGSSWKKTITLSEPQIDESGTMLTMIVGLKYGVKEGKEAQEAIGEAMNVLSGLNAKRKVIKLLPGSYEINKPIIFRKKHFGIEFVGRANAVDALMDNPFIKGHFEDQFAEASHLMPLMKGHKVSSFIVVDGVVSDKHLQTSISGFIFQNMMAGVGGTHFPDFSYRIGQADFVVKGGSYSKYAFSDGGVASVLGNASIVLKENIFINPSAYQCGGVLRNEQYGTTKIQASIVTNNIVVNPFAWHTGAIVDNAPGSYAMITDNLIILEEAKHHQVALITNFNKSFLRVENNRIIDLRPNDLHSSTIIVRNLGWDGGAIVVNNKFESNQDSFKPFVLSGLPKWHSGRDMHFFFPEGLILKIIDRLIGRNIVLPGGWPKEMDHLVNQRQFKPPYREPKIETLKAIFSYKVASLGGRGQFFPNPQVDLAGR